MRLKKLDIVGFKSFPERTQVRLVDGVTAIIGPNGCGKTNILDALRWVMGEQRPTLLRGGKMEDVIFNGSQSMKPHGMAEVSLSIQNTRGVLPTEYDEVQLTRRLFRSGESEYYLNRTQCRLRDITDLFADTGMGANAYSVIQQHMIDALISDKAEERRILFEEAAGITKYKQRKRAALRKLDSTEQDLQRLQDIVSEVKTQVNSLNRQMKKAERYQKTHIQLKHLELALASVTLKTLESERKEKSLLLSEQNDIIRGAETELSSFNAALEAQRTRQNEFDTQLADAARKSQAKSEEGHALDKQISNSRERIQSLADLRRRNETDIKACAERVGALRLDEQEVKTSLVTAEEKLQELLADVNAAEARSEEADNTALSAKSSVESHTEKLLALEGRISSGRSDTQNLSEQEQEYSKRLAELDAALAELAETITKSAGARETISAEVAECANQLERANNTATEISDKIEVLSEALETHTEKITELSATLEATQTRLRLLKETIAQHEGFGAGAAEALDNTERWPALLGAVADLITPQEGRAGAIEAALDDVAGYLVTKDRQTARDIISYLRAEKKGKAAIFALEGLKINEKTRTPRAPLSEPGFVGWAEALIAPKNEIDKLAQALLRDTAVFDERLDTMPESELQALIQRLPENTQIVSSGGSRYGGSLSLLGGSEEGLPRFGRQERARELEERITALATELESARTAKSNDTTEIARLRAELAQTDQAIETARDSRNEADKRLTEIDSTLKNLAADQERLGKEKSSVIGKLDLLKHRQYTLSLDVDQLATEKERLMSAVTERADAVTSLEQAAQKAADELNKLHVKLVEEKSVIQQLTDKALHLQELRNEIDQTRENKLKENVRAQEEIERLRIAIGELEAQLKNVFAQRDELTKVETELRSQREEVGAALREHERRARESRSTKDGAVSEAHKLDLRLSQINSETSSILEHVQEEYGVDPRSYTPDDDVETPAFDSEEALAGAKETAQELKNRLKSYGAVNLLAIEEHQSATERYESLSAQVEDLVNAKATLQSTISKINKTARELFADTFEKARLNFRSVFTELFDGGECDIRLSDPNDPLESDIEIIAKPKGKKLVTITQMSGGERALTAISLLFSLYLVKPSPFCILDEIDAPLDDANCHRFLRLIRRFSDQTQFIVITHNKITMEAADTLYGVTMESLGVSKLVSVHFTEDGEGGTRIVPVEEIDARVASTNGSANSARALESVEPIVESVAVESTDFYESDLTTEENERATQVKPETLVERNTEVPQAVVERLTPKINVPEPSDIEEIVQDKTADLTDE